jgi:hypothetical protein
MADTGTVLLRGKAASSVNVGDVGTIGNTSTIADVPGSKARGARAVIGVAGVALGNIGDDLGEKVVHQVGVGSVGDIKAARGLASAQEQSLEGPGLGGVLALQACEGCSSIEARVIRRLGLERGVAVLVFSLAGLGVGNITRVQ